MVPLDNELEWRKIRVQQSQFTDYEATIQYDDSDNPTHKCYVEVRQDNESGKFSGKLVVHNHIIQWYELNAETIEEAKILLLEKCIATFNDIRMRFIFARESMISKTESAIEAKKQYYEIQDKVHATLPLEAIRYETTDYGYYHHLECPYCHEKCWYIYGDPEDWTKSDNESAKCCHCGKVMLIEMVEMVIATNNCFTLDALADFMESLEPAETFSEKPEYRHTRE